MSSTLFEVMLNDQVEENEMDGECSAYESDEKILTLRRLMSYIYGAPILDVSRSHTTTQHSR
jgi:hypothetical protein